MAQIRGNQNIYSQSNYGGDAMSSSSWYPDSGATNHVTNDFANLTTSSEYNGGNNLLLGDGHGVPISHVGQFVAKASPSSTRALHLNNLLHVPEVSKNLLSVSHFAKDNNVFFEFHHFHCFVKDQATKAILLKGSLENGLYKFNLHKHVAVSPVPPPSLLKHAPASYSASTAFPKSTSSIDLWHKRLGHCAFNIVEKALLSCNIPYLPIKSNSLCHPCCVAKSHRLPYISSSSHYTAPLQMVHSDVWGPAPLCSRNGFKYYVNFIDQYSRYTWLYLLKSKSDVITAFKHFMALAENQFNTKIKGLQTDGGGEYKGLVPLLQSCGIQHRVSCPYTPQQNGMAERKHRHITEMGLTLLAQSGLSTSFWDDAFSTAVHIINRLPSSTLNFLSPYEKIHRKKTDYTSLKAFGCLCYPHIRPTNHHC